MQRIPLTVLLCGLLAMTGPVKAETVNVSVLGHIIRSGEQAGLRSNSCQGLPRCFAFELEESAKHLETGDILFVRYTDDTVFYDPENFLLPHDQLELEPGSHLRILLTTEHSAKQGPVAKAQTVFVGD